jgi:hypothetical protein
MSKHSHDYNLGLYDKDGKFNEKRHEELTGKKYPYTHFDDEVDYEQHPETLIGHLLWIAPALLFVGYVVYRILTT